MTSPIATTPRRIIGLYDRPMWDSIEARAMRLQRSKSTGQFIYPPAPAAPGDPLGELEWAEISGRGVILSWVIFHRHYLPAYPPPYNVIAVRLQEGPTIISNLEGRTPTESWIGCAVQLVYATMPDGVVLPRFELSAAIASG